MVLQITCLVGTGRWLRSPAVLDGEARTGQPAGALWCYPRHPPVQVERASQKTTRAHQKTNWEQLWLPFVLSFSLTSQLFYYLIFDICKGIYGTFVCVMKHKIGEPSPPHPVFLSGFFASKKSSLIPHWKYKMPESLVCHSVSFSTSSRLPFPRKVTQNPLEVHDAVLC